VYNLFLADVAKMAEDRIQVSESYFNAMWREGAQAGLVKVRKYLRFAKCSICVDLRERRTATRDREEITKIQYEVGLHHCVLA
jgi:hypothetical protein